MKTKKLFGFGALIWAVAYLVATVFVAYKMMNSPVASIVVALAAALAAYLAARSVKAQSTGTMLGYSFSWVLIAVILDLILTVPFTGWAIFSSWSLWVGYALILLVPLLAVRKSTL